MKPSNPFSRFPLFDAPSLHWLDESSDYLNKEELIKKMQDGGLVLYFRSHLHGKDYADRQWDRQ